MLHFPTLKFVESTIIQYMGNKKYLILPDDNKEYKNWTDSFKEYKSLKNKYDYKDDYSIEKYFQNHTNDIEMFPKYLNKQLIKKYKPLMKIIPKCIPLTINKYDIQYKTIRIIKEQISIPAIKLREIISGLFNNTYTRKLILQSIKDRKQAYKTSPKYIQHPYHSRFGKNPKYNYTMKYFEYKQFGKHYLIFTNSILKILNIGYFVIKDFYYVGKHERTYNQKINHIQIQKKTIKPNEIHKNKIMYIEGFNIEFATEVKPYEFIDNETLLINKCRVCYDISKCYITEIEQFKEIKNKIKGIYYQNPEEKDDNPKIQKSITKAYKLIGIRDFEPDNEPCLAVSFYGDGWGGSVWNSIHGGMYSFRIEFLDLPTKLRHKHEFSFTLFSIPKQIDKRSLHKLTG